MRAHNTELGKLMDDYHDQAQVAHKTHELCLTELHKARQTPPSDPGVIMVSLEGDRQHPVYVIQPRIQTLIMEQGFVFSVEPIARPTPVYLFAAMVHESYAYVRYVSLEDEEWLPPCHFSKIGTPNKWYSVCVGNAAMRDIKAVESALGVLNFTSSFVGIEAVLERRAKSPLGVWPIWANALPDLKEGRTCPGFTRLHEQRTEGLCEPSSSE